MREIQCLLITVAVFIVIVSVLMLTGFNLLSPPGEGGRKSDYKSGHLRNDPEPLSVEDDHKAFVRYLQMPGAEYAASRIGLSRPEDYLRILQGFSENDRSRLKSEIEVVEGDLMLALGRNGMALECYRKAARKTEPPRSIYLAGTLCTNYIVEPPVDFSFEPPAEPYTLGPGSHRDNLLIRRFIALSAWDDAQKEFERIWKIYSLLSRPYIYRDTQGKSSSSRQTHSGQTHSMPEQRYLIRSCGFNSLGLRFSLDYAYFLMRRKEKEKALAVLMEPIGEMDMDRNPNEIKKEKALSGQYPESPVFFDDDISSRLYQGVSRREFIRLAYGEFKSSGCEEKLVSTLEKQIAEGQNKARRVLARVRLHQGRTDDALALELEYIERGRYDALTKAFRQGLAFEDMQKPAEAVIEYEKALAQPWHTPEIPDEDEEQIQNRLGSPMCTEMPDSIYTSLEKREQNFQIDLLTRLHRLYVALGRKNEALHSTLRLYEIAPRFMAQPESLENVKAQFTASGSETEFLKWIKGQLLKTKEPAARTALYWVSGDYRGAAESIARCTSKDDFWSWRALFQEKGKDVMLLFLRARIKQKPDDALSRIELLDLEDRWNPSEVIPAMEGLLLNYDPSDYTGFSDIVSRAQFRGLYDFAYRLMRLYERTGQLGKLKKLGLQIAQQAKPFLFKDYEVTRYSCHDANGPQEDINACLSLLVQHADDSPTQKALQKALEGKPYPWSAAREQLSRRIHKTLSSSRAPAPFGWANAPEGVDIIASNENVLSLAADNSYVYAGMPWGVAVYTHQGKAVTRIALETDALQMVVRESNLWIASTRGLYRISIGTWNTVRLRLDGDTPEREPADQPLLSENAVHALALDGNSLWIWAHEKIQRYDISKGTLCVFGGEELKTRSGLIWQRFIVEGEYVWFDGSEGCRRYDRKTGLWESVVWGDKDVSLIALVDGVMWGYICINDELRDRVCIIDQKTLEVMPVFIEGTDRDDRCIDGPFRYFGRWRGKLVFGTDAPTFFYDAEIKKLRRIPALKDIPEPGIIDKTIPPALAEAIQRWNGEDTLICDDQDTAWHELVPGCFISGEWGIERLPDGTMVIGKGSSYPSRFDTIADTQLCKEEGGLYFVFPDGKIERVSSRQGRDVIPADTVRDIVFGSQGLSFICTNRGIAALDDRNGILTALTRSDGLRANRILNGADIGGKIYFASGWGESGGGLLVYDPATMVITSLSKSDGMARDNLRSISAEDGKLILSYGAESTRCRSGKSSNKRRPLPDIYDPVTGKFIVSRVKQRAAVNESLIPSKIYELDPMPVIGGFIVKRIEQGENIYLCGTKGLLIHKKGKFPHTDIASLSPSEVRNSSAKLIEEALELKIDRPLSPKGLKTLLLHQNPYVRARALEETMTYVSNGSPVYTSAIGTVIQDPILKVRLMAAHLLSQSADNEAVKPLQTALKDSDPYVRAIAAMSLAKRGLFAPLSYYEEILTYHDSYGNVPCGTNSTIGVVVDEEDVYSLLAPRADKEVCALFLKYPPDAWKSEKALNMMADMGRSLKKHPDMAELLLQAKSSVYDQVQFAQGVFMYAGKDMLPVLHKALESKDRVICSNAALACGGIKDSSSIPRLIKALDLESGLSRASIVRALGELEARQALPYLIKLYTDVRNDEKRHGGSGFRSGQMGAALNSEYEIIGTLDVIGSEWSELKLSTLREPLEPSYDEKLLSPEDILEAIRKIGPEAAQEFYRTLAGDREEEARIEAAAQLAQCTGEDLEKNIPVLRGLLGDDDVRICMNAAVSLLISGQIQSRDMILKWLDSPARWEKSWIIMILKRVKDPSKLVFAREKIEAAAEDESLDREVRNSARKLLKAEM